MNKKVTKKKTNKKINNKIQKWKADFDFIYLQEIIKSNIYIDRNIDFFDMLYFHIKKYFTSFTTFFLYFIPVLFIVFLGTIAPIYLLTAGIYSSSLIVSTFFVFSTCFFRIKSSTLIKYHKIKLKNLYISTLITVFISNFLITVYVTLLIFILTQIGYIYNDWFFNYNINLTEITTTFNSINWGLFVYFFFATTIITYLIALFFTLFVKSQAKFLFITVFILFYTFCFGGVLQPWFYPSPIYNSESYYDPSSNLIIVEPQILYEDNIVPFVFSLLCPFWYINVLTRFMFSNISMHYNNFQEYINLLLNNNALIGSSYIGQEVKIDYFYFSNILWDFILFGSFIVISIYSFLIELFFIKKQIKMVKWFYYRSN
ncbi:/ / hypothetical protein / 458386:459498 Reverse [Candidatus Hepatoplasma crinochetorum]|uniref:Uncharacterized protein n=1 Tax=Candidatus Hepatoplasma crinochetorum TaxID=295596 RepID=A0A0G7ZMZ4_9MOLU|nr:/ / hypothetical protein / 458386:459498 Reverse [Candidatus Hepatoplasma crinochetorum]